MKSGARKDSRLFSASEVAANTKFGKLKTIIKSSSGRRIDFSLHKDEQEAPFRPNAAFRCESFTPDAADLKMLGLPAVRKFTGKDEYGRSKNITLGTFEMSE